MTSIALRHGLRCLALLLPIVIAAQGAQASGKDNRERAARTACLSGDYTRGVRLLAELFVDTGDITYLFNQGRCFEQNGRYADAIVRFREYLRKSKDAGRASDGAAERHIADCQALLDKQTPATVPTAAPPVQSTPATVEAPSAALQTASAAQPEPAPPLPAAPAPQPDLRQAAPTGTASGSGMRIGGIATMAVGVAGIATGMILNMKANSLASELEKSTTSYSRSKESTRSTYQTFGWVAYGAGAACVVGGALLYYLGQSKNAQVALVPAAQPGQVGAVLQGTF